MSAEAIGIQPPPLRLDPLNLPLNPEPGPLRPQIEAALAVHGRPLRWAVTAVERAADGSSRLQIEAVVINTSPLP